MNFENLIQNLQVNHDTLLTSADKAVNCAMTFRNWLYPHHTHTPFFSPGSVVIPTQVGIS